MASAPGVPRPSLADYVTGTGAHGQATAAGANVAYAPTIFPHLGARVMMLNARRIEPQPGRQLILLHIET